MALSSSSSSASEQQHQPPRPSRLKTLVPTVGIFHTRLPLRCAFEAYNRKYAVTKRKHICISFNELRHILNLAQIMALRRGGKFEGNWDCCDTTTDTEMKHALKDWESSPSIQLQSDQDILFGESDQGMQPLPPPPLMLDAIEEKTSVSFTTEEEEYHTPLYNNNNNDESSSKFKGPQLITFDGDQTLYSDGANFESNLELANYLYLLLRHGVTLAVVTAAGYEYQAEKYEVRLSGLLSYFKEKELPPKDCERFYLFGGECNYLLNLGHDFRLHPVKENGPGGWYTSTKYLTESPANWNEDEIQHLLNVAEDNMKRSVKEQKIKGRVIRKKRGVGLIPRTSEIISREALDEAVLCVQEELQQDGVVSLPFCAFNGGKDVWVDVGNKRVGVEILCSYLGRPANETLHIGDQFLNTGNDFAARDICPCIWITSPDETTYILKSILRLAGIAIQRPTSNQLSTAPTYLSPSHNNNAASTNDNINMGDQVQIKTNFSEVERRACAVKAMDVYTGEMMDSYKN
eukprot:CAMPEP_0197825108 /NCGR_PEP_ID=MMETSP1437-20131217/2243_1 /TAXON_ID=49252 ORGANISM="Eucampia antarctica, Strain CCMP1452" /NCGR_SAMPLE_ID=MMETSP1437 /ASSEMBLY_ACC=CAM_ASM_001096 /LENGTH=517 /DNA_ID=CAMNT_0043424975 /DNA_START=301 /DNA_END=1854 /DNA_ORIENTATION=-